MEAKARLRNCPTSPRKMRKVADMVRGAKVEDALNILKFSKQHASRNIEKLIISAISNWEQANEGLNAVDNDLVVKTITVDSGRMLKRFRPAPFGRPHRIRKRSNHVTVVLDSTNGSDASAQKEQNEE